MFRIPIPNWVHYIITEFDGTVWGYRYAPNLKDEIGEHEGRKSVRSTQKHDGRVEIIAVVNPGDFKPCTIKTPAVINNKAPFLGSDQSITTQEGEDYKDFTFKQFLLDQVKQEKK